MTNEQKNRIRWGFKHTPVSNAFFTLVGELGIFRAFEFLTEHRVAVAKDRKGLAA